MQQNILIRQIQICSLANFETNPQKDLNPMRKDSNPFFLPQKLPQDSDSANPNLQGVPKVPHTFVFGTSLKSLGAHNKMLVPDYRGNPGNFSGTKLIHKFKKNYVFSGFGDA
jgi:hypothetical protein